MSRTLKTYGKQGHKPGFCLTRNQQELALEEGKLPQYHDAHSKPSKPIQNDTIVDGIEDC